MRTVSVIFISVSEKSVSKLCFHVSQFSEIVMEIWVAKMYQIKFWVSEFSCVIQVFKSEFSNQRDFSKLEV